MRRGFTLIEIMLAIAILAIVGTLIYGGFAQTTLNKTRIESDIDHYRTVNMALERMAREVNQAFVSTHENPSLDLRTVHTVFDGKDNGREDRLDFTSFSHRRLYRNAKESDQNEISYFVTEDPDEPGSRVLARRQQNRIDEEPRKGGKSQILVRGVEEFNIEYFDPLLSEWVQEWTSDDRFKQANRLPTQVRFRLTVRDPTRPGNSHTFGTRATIPLTYALNHANYNP
ncbi:MAG: type II secretion system protein GspJ [Myxococcota bacterium]